MNLSDVRDKLRALYSERLSDPYLKDFNEASHKLLSDLRNGLPKELELLEELITELEATPNKRIEEGLWYMLEADMQGCISPIEMLAIIDMLYYIHQSQRCRRRKRILRDVRKD